MNKIKSTKRALLTSAAAVLVCVAMLIGTTYAWFTDTASVGVNRIQSGTLEVDIKDENGESLDGGMLKWVKAEGAEDEDILWEPGAKYRLTPFKIVSTGKLALKYKIVISGLEGDAELLDVISFDYTLDGEEFDISAEGHLGKGQKETGFITITGKMDENAGNYYQDRSIDGIGITVYATQDTVENDSFGNTYDENAEYDKEKFKDDMTANKKDIVIDLDGNVTYDVAPWDGNQLGGAITESITINGNGHKMTFNNTNSDWNRINIGNAKLIIKDAVIDNSGYNADGGPWNSHDIVFNGNVELQNVTFLNAVAVSGTASFKNVSIADPYSTGDAYMLWICAGSDVTAENLTINGKSAVGNANRAIKISDQYISAPDVTKLTINGATFSADKKAAVYVGTDGGADITLKGIIDITEVEENKTDVVAIEKAADKVTVNKDDAKNVELKNAETQEELNTILSDSNVKAAKIVLPENAAFTVDNGVANGQSGKSIRFVGDGSQTVDVITKSVSAEGGQLNYQRGASMTFENVKIAAGTGNFDGVVCDELVYKNCTIEGKLTLYGKASFIGCTFENTMANQYSIWTWGGTDVLFEDCTFNTNGKAILLYGQATAAKPTNLTVNGCTFNDRNNGTAGKAAIEIGNDYNATYNLVVNNAKVNGFAAGKNTGSKLWANKNSMDAAHLNVVIDGKDVH